MTAEEQGVRITGRDADRVAAMVEGRDEHAREVVATAHRFPTYEVPEFVRERFPGFRPEDPETWPEPSACTDGRPWGHDSYAPGGILGRDPSDRWRRWLAAADRAGASERPSRYRDRDLGCRNRWRHDDSRLCGTHDRPWREAIEVARRRVARNAREEEHRDLARQLAAHGIVADGYADAVRLQADAVRDLLRLLGEVTASPPSWPDQGPTPEPPL